MPLDLPTTGHGGADPVFLMEGDEYVTGPDDRRSKFAYYHPDAVLLSSLVHDHVNVFPTMADYEAPFAGLIADLPADGLLVCAHAFEPLHRLTRGRDVVWYGLDPCPGYHADGIAIGEVTTFELVTPGGMRIALRTELLGLHNIENIVGAAAFLLERGEIDVGALQRGVARFRGVARRLDKKTAISRVPVYEASVRPTKRPARRSRRSCSTSLVVRPWWCSSPTPSAGAIGRRSAGTTRCSKASRASSSCRRRPTAPTISWGRRISWNGLRIRASP